MKYNYLSKMLTALGLLFVLAACGGAETSTPQADPTEVIAPTEAVAPTEEIEATELPELAPEDPAAPAAPTVETMMRDSGLLVTVHDYGDVVVHSLTAPEQVFANSTHIIETPNNLVLIDTQFLLPNAMDFRAYADSLGKPIDRVFITHHHPDHFLGSEAFADLAIFSLAETSAAIAEVGQAEVDEKQADFGAAIASTFVVPQVVEPGTMEIDGVPFEFSLIKDAEAENQLVVRLPEQNVIAVGDIVYSGVHLIMAGAPSTWIDALNMLKSMGSEQTVVLAGHGVPGGADLYDANIAWLAKAGELIGTVSTGEAWKAGLIEAFPDLGMPAAMDFVAPFLFPEESTVPAGLIEVITVELAEDATVESFLPANQMIEDEYASQQPGYLARETAVSEDGLVRLSVHWESKADSDASIAGFGEAPGLEAFMGNLNAETMVIKQYDLLSSTSGQVTFPGAGVTEVITVRLQDGADADDFLAANQALEENYIVEQPGFIAREIGLSEDGEWLIVIHWETAEDSAASIAKFEEAPGVEAFMSFLDAETMAITVYDFPEESTPAGLIEVITVELAEEATVEAFLPANQVIEDEYASLQPGYLARETAVSEDGLVRLSVHWESKADSDASIAGFGEAPGLEAFMGNLNAETMVIKQYDLLSSTSGQVTFPGAGVTEVITVRLQDGADADEFLAANQALEESYIVEQPGFIAREISVSEDGEWLIVIHWETAEDSAASIAKFGEAPGVEAFMSFLDTETMTITVYDIQQ